MYKMLLGAAFGLLLLSDPALAACTVPNTLTNGTTADATAVMGNFTSLAGCAAPLASPSFAGTLTLNGPSNNYAIARVNSLGGVGNGWAAILELVNANNKTGQMWMADSGSGTAFYVEANMLTMSTESGYGIKINTNGTDNNGLRIATNGATSCYPSCSNVSDRRIKTDIVGLSSASGLAAINALRPVSYHWKDPKKGGAEQIGFLAQEVRNVFPQVVLNTGIITKDVPDGILSVNYSALTAPMVLAIQQLDARTVSAKLAGETALFDRRQAGIEPLRDDALSLVKQLRPASFRPAGERDYPNGRQIGFVAQDVQAVAPDLVIVRKGKEETPALKSGSLIPLLIKAVQQQQDEIVAQKMEIARLRSEMSSLATKVRVQTASR